MPFTDRDQQRANQRAFLKMRRDEWFAANGPCRQCGSWENLELDHLEQDGKVSHRIWSWARERRERELAKCQALCERCHGEKTKQQLRRPITHGTRGGYKRGCRCASCTKASAVYCREKRHARKAREMEANGWVTKKVLVT